MRKPPIKRSRFRCARFERFDERVVLSGVVLISDVLPNDSVCVATPIAPAVSSSNDSLTNVGPDFGAVSAEYARLVYGLRGNGQTVAIIDSGIAYDHQALGGGFGPEYRVVGGQDFTEENDADPYDDGPAGFHGTHVAGIIASDDPSHTGIAPDVDLVAVRVFNDFGSGSIQWVEQALQWVYESRNDFQNPITTVNLSLGVSWNDLVLPDWATLEDELGQLDQAGIFVTVAAGNSFVDFGSVGLNYPAVSPHVVPAASVNAEGMLSDFSQRGPSVLAGLGEQIVSTVPDHIYGSDGIFDDWAASTGTSMAAPFVAGASVLVREAMQSAGYESIDHGVIYDHLRSTADLVFDSTTNAWYHRINLPRALDTILLAEDGALDTASAPVQLDGDTLVVQGTEGDDVVNLTMHDQFVVRFNGQQFTFSLQQVARFELHGAGGNDQLRVEGAFPHGDIGRASTSTVLRPGSAEIDAMQWRLAADSFEQITVLAPGGFDDVARLYDSATNDEFTSHSNENVLKGDDFENRVIGFDRVYAYASSGLDDIARMFDSSGSDQFIARPESSILKGAGFHNKALGFDRVNAYASTGRDDVARFYDSANNDRLNATPESTSLTGADFFNEATGFNRTYAYSGGGTDDVANLFDSAGNDEFVATANHGYLRGSGFYNKAIGFSRVYAHASDGSDDVARLHDSPYDDVFESNTDSSLLRGEGFYNHAAGFDRVYGYSSGGRDYAQLTGSTGSDQLYSWSGRNVLRGTEYYTDVRGFKNTSADLVSGRDDVAYLHDSAGDDTYVGIGNRGLWQAGGYSTSIERLDRVRAFSRQGGNDVALLQTSLSSDYMESGSMAVLTDQQSRHEVNDFEQVSLDGLMDDDYLATLDHLFEFTS